MILAAPWQRSPMNVPPSMLQEAFREASPFADKLLHRAGITAVIYYEWGDLRGHGRINTRTVAIYHDLLQFSYETACKFQPLFKTRPQIKEFFGEMANYPPGAVISLNTDFAGRNEYGEQAIYSHEELVHEYVRTLIHEYGHAIFDFFRVVTPELNLKLEAYYTALSL